MRIDNNPSLKPQTDGTQPQIDIPEGGTIDILNVRELDATLINTTTVNTRDVNAMNVEGQSIRGTVADVDKLAVQEEISLTAESVDISSYSQLLVLDEDGLVQKTTVDDVKTVLDDSFVTPSELTTALNGYVKNDTTNTTVNDFNNCPIGFISMPASSSNAPSSSRCYCLTQYYNNNNYKTQIATVINTNDVYVRNYNNGTWSAWVKLIVETDLKNYQKSKYIALGVGASGTFEWTNIYHIIAGRRSNSVTGEWIGDSSMTDNPVAVRAISGVTITSTTGTGSKICTITNNSSYSLRLLVNMA